MTTLNQLIRRKVQRQPKLKKTLTPGLKGNPFCHAVCLKILTKTPKKPNSALRKIAKIRVLRKRNKKDLYAHIPGIGHNLNIFNHVLVRGGRVPDLPGIRYRLVRNKYDLEPVYNRITSRSKYGKKKPTKSS